MKITIILARQSAQNMKILKYENMLFNNISGEKINLKYTRYSLYDFELFCLSTFLFKKLLFVPKISTRKLNLNEKT